MSMASGRTRRKPRFGGSVKNCNITPLEYKEYEQTGMIRVKETPAEGYDFRKWSWGYHRCINFGEVLGAKEIFRTDEDYDLPASARLLDTLYGIIAVDNCPTCYIITCTNYYQKSALIRDFDLYGYRTTSHGAKTLIAYKPRKEFVAYQREDR